MSTIFDTRYYRVTKLFASLVGLWPYQSQLRRRVIQSLNIFIMSTWIPCQLKRLYHVWGKDLDAVCMNILSIVTILASLAKLVTSALFVSKVKMLLHQIESDWNVNPRTEEYKILVNYTSKARRLCIIYSTMLCNGLMCFIMIPTIPPLLDIISPSNQTRVRSFAYEGNYGVDLQIHWLPLWLHSSATSSTIILNIIGADLIYVTLTIHACCLFVIVRYKLENISNPVREYAVQSFENYNHEYYVYLHENRQLKLKKQAAAVKECIINHQKAIEYVQLLHCIYTWCFLAILGSNLILISISAVQLVSRLLQWDGMVMSLMFIIGQVTHLYFLSLMAQYVLNQSSNVHKSIYSCCWYDMPLKMQKDIILVVIRSRVPCKVMAGKLFVMSLENFCSIVQTAVSYFTVLASFR